MFYTDRWERLIWSEDTVIPSLLAKKAVAFEWVSLGLVPVGSGIPNIRMLVRQVYCSKSSSCLRSMAFASSGPAIVSCEDFVVSFKFLTLNYRVSCGKFLNWVEDTYSSTTEGAWDIMRLFVSWGRVLEIQSFSLVSKWDRIWIVADSEIRSQEAACRSWEAALVFPMMKTVSNSFG